MSDLIANRRGLLLPAVFLLAAAAAALLIDVPVATGLQRLAHESQSKDPAIREPARARLAWLGNLDMFEPFGHGVGVVVIVLALYQLDPQRRWAIPRVLACALAAGLAADLLKTVIMRTRPYELPFPFDGPVWKTFGQWWPILGAGSQSLTAAASQSQSFPSAHTATAAGLAAALIWLYPQGRVLFTVLALLVGCQRVAAAAHYPSDVLVGAAVGCLVAALLLRIGPLPARIDHWERRWKQPPLSNPAT